MKKSLSGLKSGFLNDLRSHAVNKISCNGCNSICLGQTARHITTRMGKHSKPDKTFNEHLPKCTGDRTSFQWEIIDQFTNIGKLMISDIRRCKPALNTRDEFPSRQLTMKY